MLENLGVIGLFDGALFDFVALLGKPRTQGREDGCIIPARMNQAINGGQSDSRSL
jgi:hypothetical protein